MDIASEIKNLKFDPSSFVVISSSALVLLGILPAKSNQDIDMVVTPEVYTKLLHDGWERSNGWNDEPVLRHSFFDVGAVFNGWTAAELQKDAVMVQGIRVINPAKLLTWMQSAGRDKDIERIPLLEAYLSKR